MSKILQAEISGGFEGLVANLPTTRVTVEALTQISGMDSPITERLKAGGLRKVPVAEGQAPLSSLVSGAIAELATQVSALESRTIGILFCHSLPTSEPDFLRVCLRPFNLLGIPRTQLTGQPCSILHFGIQLAVNWLREAKSGEGVLVLGGDVARAPRDRIFFNSAMGDSAVAGFLTRESTSHKVIACLSEGEIIAPDGETSDSEQISRFRLENPTRIRTAIELILHAAALGLQDLKFIVPHTPYNAIWDAVSALTGFPRNRILTDYLPETGHLNSNDSVAHYVRAVTDARILPGDYALLMNPGFGGVRGCTLIRH